MGTNFMKPMILSDEEFNSLPDAEIQPKSPMILSDEEFNSLPDSEDGLKTDSTVEPDTSALEAAVTGLGQEASFGFADELAGLAGASLDRPITYLLDKLQGVPSDLAGEPEDSTFGERYVQSRDIARRQAKQAEETQPGAYLGGQIGGGVAQAVATGGAGLAAQAAKQGAKQLIKKGAIEGAKYGAKQGLGRSEAEVLEGDVVGLLKDVGLEAGLGAATGGAISAAPVMAKGAASKAGELLKKIPGVESGYKLGKEGISTSYEALMKEFKSTSKSLSSDIRNTLKKQGIDKADALELADSIGISINAGDSIETAIEKAVDLKNVPEGQRGQFITFLQKTIGDDPELNKKLAKLDQTRAKQLEKAAREGYELQATEQIGKRIEDVVPDSSVQGTLMGTEDVLKKTTPEGQELVKKNLNLQTLPDDASIPNIDVRSLKPTQIEELRKQVNKFANPSKKEGVTELEQVARSLAVDLNNLSNKATAGTSVQEANTKIATLLDAIRQSGMRGKVSATESATETIGARFLREQQEKDLNKTLMRFGQDADVDIQSFFSRLKEVDPKFAKIEEKNKYLRDAMTIAQSGQGSASTNVRSLVGGAQKTAALVSNVAGKAARKLESASPSKALLAAGREIMESSPEAIQNVIQRVGSNPKYQSMVSQLQKAAEATTDTARKQVLFGLKQQPAFREMLRDAGMGIQPKEEEVEDLTQEQQPSLDNKTSLIDNTKDLLEKFSDIMIPKAAAADKVHEKPVYEDEDLINDLKLEEGVGDKTGAAKTGYFGVTDNARSAVNTLNSYKKSKTENEKESSDDKTMRLYLKYLYSKSGNLFKKLPRDQQKAALNLAYNRGEGFLSDRSDFLKTLATKGIEEAFLQVLERATIKPKKPKSKKEGSKSSIGLSKRYATKYNSALEKLDPTKWVKTVRQGEDGVDYIDAFGNVIATVSKPMHEGNNPGELTFNEKRQWVKPKKDTKKSRMKKQYDDEKKLKKLKTV